MGGGTDGDASMRYQHTNTSHNRSSGFSSVAEIAGGMGLRSPQQLALDFDAHTYPQVARGHHRAGQRQLTPDPGTLTLRAWGNVA